MRTRGATVCTNSDDLGPAGTAGGELGSGDDDEAESCAHRAAVDDVAFELGLRPGCLLCSLDRGREIAAQRDDDHLGGAGVRGTLVGLRKRPRRRCGSGRQFGIGPAALPEVGRAQLDTVDEGLGAEADLQRHDRDAELGDGGVAEITGTVGDDVHLGLVCHG